MRILIFSFFFVCAIFTIYGNEEPHFNFGIVKIENSGLPEAQPIFLQGLAAMHSFEYKEALIDFRRAQEIDPNFALAYWGEAMAYNQAFWRHQDFEAARATLNKLGKTPEERINKAEFPLEKDLIQSLDILYGEGSKEERDQKYSDYMAQIYNKYPKDLEALSLYVLSILGTIQPNESSFRKNIKAAGVLDSASGFNPSREILNHPGILHYYIHALDDPIHAILALKSANLYANVAPDAAHAVHMTSHIYVQLGMWDKAQKSNKMSYDTSIKWVNERTQNLADREYHSLYWLMYANLQLGRYVEARQNVDHISNLLKKDPACPIEGHWALMSARYMIETQDCITPFSLPQLQNMQDCYVSNEPQAYSFIYAIGFCALIKKDFANAAIAIKSLEELRENLKDSKTRTTKILSEKDKEFRINILTISIDELLAIRDQIDGNILGALDRLEQASEIESKMSLPKGIPVSVQSALELYGFFLLRDKQWLKAKSIFLEALNRVPNRAKSYVGLAMAMEGMNDLESAKKYATQALNVWSNADSKFSELDEAHRLSK